MRRVGDLATAYQHSDSLPCSVVNRYLRVQLGMIAFENGRYSEAADKFKESIPSLTIINGIHPDPQPIEHPAPLPPSVCVSSTPYIKNISTRLQNRFEQRGVPSDLDEAIELHQAALLLRPPGHSCRSITLNSLASSLRNRFEHRGVPSDLDEAIELHQAALLLRPLGHSDRSMTLNNLALSIQNRFEQRGVPSDLDETIELYQAALLLLPPGHSHRSTTLNNLALSLHNRFEQRGVPSDLDETIELYQAALLLLPPGHSHRSTTLNNLALSLQNGFEQRGVPSDLDEAIELHQAALLLRPPGHSHRSWSLNDLANSLKTRFEQCGVPSDLDEAFRLYVQLSYLSHAVSRRDLTTAKSWATSAENTNHDSALLAYQTALKFLDQHVTILSPSPHLFDVVRMATASLAMDAFSCSTDPSVIFHVEPLPRMCQKVVESWLASPRPVHVG
ncbi:hypothetical protein DEU56DRAFT_984497 [Suillus clintonianus]|uniref:uncharacterized protein n=1 Tax=Suillus clintonianus TaxID=1904413 RepID=UPI001B87F7AD|nr:uncharacterized protein DEU56DRAFT_984497 [Suillus clintonianus]KAG2120155.1 hypothetical protein DEU56DRAFT_984497 [Suillus clintonianus]